MKLSTNFDEIFSKGCDVRSTRNSWLDSVSDRVDGADTEIIKGILPLRYIGNAELAVLFTVNVEGRGNAQGGIDLPANLWRLAVFKGFQHHSNSIDLQQYRAWGTADVDCRRITACPDFHYTTASMAATHRKMYNASRRIVCGRMCKPREWMEAGTAANEQCTNSESPGVTCNGARLMCDAWPLYLSPSQGSKTICTLRWAQRAWAWKYSSKTFWRGKTRCWWM